MRGCSNCKYYNNTCGRYLMNPELLKDPKECGKSETGYPHWELKITNEIKSKVLAQYYNKMYVSDGRKYRLTGERIDNIQCGENGKLILKPLSEITEEDAIEVDKIISPQYSEVKHFHTVTRGKVWIKDILAGNQVSNIIQVYQFLQSKGYDLPNYFLGNKTLQESGLAVY